jgi:O-acetyl-ADP-ribose deacetylase (regulator of RNase III)
MDLQLRGTTIRVVRGDITEQATDVIVNAANPELIGGGGVDGAIHRKGGRSILAECRAIRAELGRPLAHGDAVLTGAGDLPARWVVHAVGPIWTGGHRGENTALERAYDKAIQLALGAGARSIAFPSISTGAYGFPIDRAAFIAANTITRHVFAPDPHLEEIRMVLFSQADHDVYAATFTEVMRTMVGTGG